MSELSAKDLPKRDQEVNTMEILKHGSMTATQAEMSPPKQMVVLELMPLPPVLELNAKDLQKRNIKVLLNIMVIHRHGLMIAIQAEMLQLKQMVELELMPQHLQELVSSAKDLPKRNLIALLSIMVTLKLGSMIATQEEMLQLKPTVELE